jgi:hypothetical protein
MPVCLRAVAPGSAGLVGLGSVSHGWHQRGGIWWLPTPASCALMHRCQFGIHRFATAESDLLPRHRNHGGQVLRQQIV